MAANKLLTATEKSDLKAKGLWGDFLALREKNKQKGVPNAIAERDAYGELLSSRNLHPSQSGGQLPTAPSALSGKESTEVEIIRWVARNIDNPAACAEECPDPFAWTLLRQCREMGSSFVTFFVEKLWSKLIPSKAQVLSGVEETDVDGQGTIDFLVKIGAIRDKANSGVVQPEARMTHTHEVGGSNPSPASIPIEEGKR